jgi:hypothetical protein
MSIRLINRFEAWAKSASRGRGLVCHFYIKESSKQYYDNSDFAQFNLNSDSSSWLVKGTPGHGIRSIRGKSSQVPCLNCFVVNDVFYDALRELSREGNTKFELGVIFNKRALANQFHVISVSTEFPHPLPPPNKCHYYDIPRKRAGVLSPFHYCDVVRIEIPPPCAGEEPIAEISSEAVLALLVKAEHVPWVAFRLEAKDMIGTEYFALL